MVFMSEMEDDEFDDGVSKQHVVQCSIPPHLLLLSYSFFRLAQPLSSWSSHEIFCSGLGATHFYQTVYCNILGYHRFSS
jgi:hypothetical protein